MSNKKVLMAALICGLLTALAVNFYLKSVKEAAVNRTMKKVAVAAMYIPARSLITADMVSIREIPEEYTNASAVSDPVQVIGQSARTEIAEGEQILNSKLIARESTGATLSYAVPLGMRAISITVNEQSGLGGLLNPGDRVDVMGTVDIEEQSKDPNVNTIKHTMTHLILQNIEVLAVGKNYTDPNSIKTDTKDADKSKSGGGESTVTLAVPTAKMQFLVAVSDKGKLTLALRAPADKSEEDRPAIDALQLLR